MAENVGQRRAGSGQCGRKAVDLRVAVVADDQALVGIEHAQANRHAADRGLQALARRRLRRQTDVADQALPIAGDGLDQDADLVLALPLNADGRGVIARGEPPHGFGHPQQRRGDVAGRPGDRRAGEHGGDADHQRDEENRRAIDLVGAGRRAGALFLGKRDEPVEPVGGLVEGGERDAVEVAARSLDVAALQLLQHRVERPSDSRSNAVGTRQTGRARSKT